MMIICDTGRWLLFSTYPMLPTQFALTYGEASRPHWLYLSPVLAEVCYFLETRVGPAAEAQFLRSIVAGDLELAKVKSADLERMAEPVTIYADFLLGAAVDASAPAPQELHR